MDIIVLYATTLEHLLKQIALMELLGFVKLNEYDNGYDERNDQSFMIQAMRKP